MVRGLQIWYIQFATYTSDEAVLDVMNIQNLSKEMLGAILFLSFAVLIFVVWPKTEKDMYASLLKGKYHDAYSQALKAAKKGDSAAQNVLGNLYYLGLGVERDYKRSTEWYLRSALGGYGPAQVNMGHMHAQGLGVKKDPVTTLGWYWLAKIGGYKNVVKHIKVKHEEMDLRPSQVHESQRQFSSLEFVRKRLLGTLSPLGETSR